MTREDALNAAWLCVTLAAVVVVGGAFEPTPRAQQGASAGAPRAFVPSVVDAAGRAVPVRAYHRIASASAFADQLLFELAEPQRIVALSQHGRAQTPEPHRYGARALIALPLELERLLSLRADLLFVTHLSGGGERTRLMASGTQIFDLGETRGLASLERSLLSMATLLGDRSRGERVFLQLQRRMRAVASDVPEAARRSALYLASYAGKLYGGTRGTSYFDVLEAAGLHDLAAERYRDWPAYDPEQVLALDPGLIVTNTGMQRALCGNAWAHALRACAADSGGVIELPSALIGDPGLRMLEAAEALHERVYGAPASRSGP